MNRALVVVLLLALLAAVAVLVFFRGGDASLPTEPTAAGDPEMPASATAGPNSGTAEGAPSDANSHREMVEVKSGDPQLDPEIKAALCGFKGRVVDARKVPVAGCGVRLYRGAMDSILREGLDLFADEPTLVPDYVAGEGKTGDDGTFVLAGVWPRAFFLLLAGIGTDAPSHRILARSPAPGEIVDLGDIVLDDSAVVTGIVVDEDGAPIAGALVRGVDLPGQIMGLLPFERFDPDGFVLIRERSSPVHVLAMPKWVKGVFEHLPIASTRSDADGKFRLAGLVPGNNLVAATRNGYLSDVKPSVPLKAGQTKDLGKLRLKRGEELSGRVVDAAGKPVPAAEVVAGSTVSVAPVDFALAVGPADADGRFKGQGFAAGKVTVAARRGPTEPWVLAEPQAILGEITVTLPATFAVTLVVTAPDGTPVAAPRLRLLQGECGKGAAEMAALGFVPPVDLRQRTSKLEDGRTKISGLAAGKYSLLVESEGYGTGSSGFEIATSDVDLTVRLPEAVQYAVRVLGPEDVPIRAATIYIQQRGAGQLMDMPLCCGRTDPTGRLALRQASTDLTKVSAQHPRWGSVHGELKKGDGELVLRMQQPGSIEGVLTDSGKPVPPGKWTIAAERRAVSGGYAGRGATEEVPPLATPGLDGRFVLKALQPGNYHVGVIKALDALASPGGVFALAQEMFMSQDTPHEEVVIAPGQTVQVQLDLATKRYTGPTAHLFGSVEIDGRLGTGHAVMVWSNGRHVAKVDERGRFDLGQIAVGWAYLSLMGSEDGTMMFDRRQLWSSSVELKEGEEKEITISFQTSGISGTVHSPDGTGAAGCWVSAQGRAVGSKDQNLGFRCDTDAAGNFKFEKLPAGIYSLTAEGRGDSGGKGKLDGLEVQAGQPVTGVRIEMHAKIVVKGRVEVASVVAAADDWVWMQWHRVQPDEQDGKRSSESTGVGAQKGDFSSDDLVPGRYRVSAYVQIGGDDKPEWREFMVENEIEVPAQGLEGLHLRFVPKPQEPPRQLKKR